METFCTTEPFTLWYYQQGHGELGLRRVCDPTVLEPDTENIEIKFLGVFYLEIPTGGFRNLAISSATPEEEAYIQERTVRCFYEGDQYWALTSDDKRYFIGSGSFGVIRKALPYSQWFDHHNHANQVV